MSPQAPLPAATFVYKSDPVRGRQWAEVFRAQAPEIDFRIWPDMGDPAKVRFLAAWEPPENISECFPNLQVLFSSGAGVDQFNFAALPPALPVVRMVEPGIVQGMVEYVTRAVLDLHRDMPQYRRQQQRGEWKALPVRPASQRRVGVLGLGSLGLHVSSWFALLAGITFNNAGYLAENFRGGLKAVPTTQMRAARSLGMSAFQAYRMIIVPQLLRVVFYPLSNQMVWAVLMTSLGVIVGLNNDLTGVTQDYNVKTFRTFEYFAIAAVLYYLIAKAIVAVARLMAWRLFRY